VDIISPPVSIDSVAAAANTGQVAIELNNSVAPSAPEYATAPPVRTESHDDRLSKMSIQDVQENAFKKPVPYTPHNGENRQYMRFVTAICCYSFSRVSVDSFHYLA
jgi:hypothetical protein